MPEITEESFIVDAVHQGVPPHVAHGLYGYQHGRKRPGQCLSAILSDELFSAVATADTHVREALPRIILFVRNTLPTACYGSRRAVSEWLS